MSKLFFLVLLLCLLSGCSEFAMHEPSFIDTALETIQALTVANTASAPVNPYVVPIGVGLASLSAGLEALRRKERSSRKHAESELRANGQIKTPNGS